jgi:hypothetical protein
LSEHSIHCRINRKKVSAEALEREKEIEARGRARGCSTLLESATFCGRKLELRRAISQRWWRLWFGIQREMGEKVMALIRKGLKGAGVRYWGSNRRPLPLTEREG